MFIAHMPAGYLLTKAIQKKTGIGKYLWLGLLASILPDLDIIYFYLIDGRQTPHHDYWIHMPFWWFVAAMVVFPAVAVMREKRLFMAMEIFFGNIFLHLLLDTVVGGIKWLYPFVDKRLYLVIVPKVHDWWVWNFVSHWTFLLEIALVLSAVVLVVRDFTVNPSHPAISLNMEKTSAIRSR